MFLKARNSGRNLIRFFTDKEHKNFGEGTISHHSISFLLMFFAVYNWKNFGSKTKIMEWRNPTVIDMMVRVQTSPAKIKWILHVSSDWFETQMKKITLRFSWFKSRGCLWKKKKTKKYLRYHPSFLCRFMEILQPSLDDNKIPTALYRGFIRSCDYR